MGTDIHAHIEVIHKDNNPGTTYTEHFAKISIARDYSLFDVLAEVRHNPQLMQRRSSISKPKGFPPNLSSTVKDATIYQIDDELSELEVDGYCSTEDAKAWVGEGSSQYDDKNRETVTDPDIHTASFMNSKELDEANEMYRQIMGEFHYEISAVIAAMNALNNDTCESRFVFWFKG